MSVGSWLPGSAKIGDFARAAVVKGFEQYGRAGTGTPISSLHGAARTKSTLAAVGRAVGAPSMKAGGRVLGAVQGAPTALLLGGYVTMGAVKFRAMRRAEAGPEQEPDTAAGTTPPADGEPTAT